MADAFRILNATTDKFQLSEITDGIVGVTATKTNIAAAIADKGVDVPDDALLGNMPSLISSIDTQKPEQSKSVSPTLETQTVQPDDGCTLSDVTVQPVTSTLLQNLGVNLTPENLVEGANLLGIEGIRRVFPLDSETTITNSYVGIWTAPEDIEEADIDFLTKSDLGWIPHISFLISLSSNGYPNLSEAYLMCTYDLSYWYPSMSSSLHMITLGNANGSTWNIESFPCTLSPTNSLAYIGISGDGSKGLNYGNNMVTNNSKWLLICLQLQPIAASLESIEVTTAPNKTTYAVGDTFDTTGMVVKATIGGTQAVITDYTCSPTTITSSTTAITISYTWNGVTKTTTQPITVCSWNSWTANLKVNSSTSSTSSSCYLTWSAASTTPASTITYKVYFGGTHIATTSNLYYSVSSSYTTTATSSKSIYIKAYSDTLGDGSTSSTVTYTYKSPSTTISATGSLTKTSSGTDSSSTPIVAHNSSTGYAGYTFSGSSAFSSFSTAKLYFYVTAAASTVKVVPRDGSVSWYSYNTGLGSPYTSVSTSVGWNSVDITSELNTLISNVGASQLTSYGLKIFFRSENTVKIAGYSSSYPAYIVLT